MKARIAATIPNTRLPKISHAAMPVIPEVRTPPKNRPTMPRSTIAMIGTRMNPIHTKSEYDETTSAFGPDRRSGSCSASPSIAFMIAAAPASMPPAKSPVRK